METFFDFDCLASESKNNKMNGSNDFDNFLSTDPFSDPFPIAEVRGNRTHHIIHILISAALGLPATQ